MRNPRNPRHARSALVAAGLTAATVLATPLAARADTSPEPAAESTQCSYGHWPAAASGEPKTFHAGATEGVYLWHNDHGWHLAVTHSGDQRVEFKGSIASSSRITEVARRDERNDTIVQRGERTVQFTFENFGGIDGIDFHLACGRGFKLSATVNGQRISTSHVFVGEDSVHPKHMPMTVLRTKK
jgi:hypothetical protein